MALFHPQMAIAQWVPQYGNITQGMFGYREIGRPIVTGNQATGLFGSRIIGGPMSVPGPSNFSNNIQFSPNGFRVNNNQYYGYQVNTPFSAQGAGYMPMYPNTPELNNATINNNGTAPETNMLQGVNPAEQGYPVNTGAVPGNAAPGAVPAGTTSVAAQAGANLGTAQGGTNPAAAGQGANPGAMPAVAANATPQRARFRTASVLSAPPQPYSRSPELSARLTSIARSRGMLASQGINVYLSNDVALLQGTVRTPSDRDTLANVLSLEPEVEHIDNRLAVGTTGN